jgi:D-alanyl-D-alanine carboxypeptidase
MQGTDILSIGIWGINMGVFGGVAGLKMRKLTRNASRFGVFAMLSAGLVLGAGMDLGAEAAKKTSKKKAPLPEVSVDEILSPNPMLLLDVDTGKVLYHRNGNQKWYPASLTKLKSA